MIDCPAPARERVPEGARVEGAKLDDAFDEVLRAAKIDVSKDISGRWYSPTQMAIYQRWLKTGVTHEQIIAAVADVARRTTAKVSSLEYFSSKVTELRIASTGRPSEDTHEERVRKMIAYLEEQEREAAERLRK
jgi:hypothetical protein